MSEYDDAVIRSAEANKKLNNARAAKEDSATVRRLQDVADALAKEVEERAAKSHKS
jgi:hypothetical protein